jgi:hypothetical protein
LPTGKRRRLPLGGPQGFLQLAAEAFDLLPQARVLLLQALILFQTPLQLLPQQPVLPFQFLQSPEQVALTPLLMAAVGIAEGDISFRGPVGVADLEAGLRPIPDRPLHYQLRIGSGVSAVDAEIMPYFQVTDEWFSCFQLVSTRRG